MTKSVGPAGGLVYSSEFGRMCPGCSQPVDRCQCRPGARAGGGQGSRPSKSGKVAQVPASDGIVRLQRQTKGRQGKGVTLVTGVMLPEDDLKALAKALKQKCGSGGTLKDGIIEIQGDHRDLLLAELQKRGYTVKIAGG